MTRPDLMHCVHTLMRFNAPLLIFARTSCKLGSQRLLVLLLAWLTLCPYIGLLPQTSQRFMISPDDQNIDLYSIITLFFTEVGGIIIQMTPKCKKNFNDFNAFNIQPGPVKGTLPS